MAVATGLQLEQPAGLPCKCRVGQPLEGLAEHDEAASRRVACAEVEVAQPALPPSATPFGRQHHEVECRRRLDLQPGGAPNARRVTGRHRLGHHALVTHAERRVDERVRLCRGRREHAGDEPSASGDRFQHGSAARERFVNHLVGIDGQAIEEEGRERQIAAHCAILGRAPEAAHGHLERLGLPVGLERKHFSVEHESARGHRAHSFDDLGHGTGHLTQVAREHADLGPLLVHLNSRAVELAVECQVPESRARFVHAGRRLGEHRLHGMEDAERELINDNYFGRSTRGGSGGSRTGRRRV